MYKCIWKKKYTVSSIYIKAGALESCFNTLFPVSVLRIIFGRQSLNWGKRALMHFSVLFAGLASSSAQRRARERRRAGRLHRHHGRRAPGTHDLHLFIISSETRLLFLRVDNKTACYRFFSLIWSDRLSAEPRQASAVRVGFQRFQRWGGRHQECVGPVDRPSLPCAGRQRTRLLLAAYENWNQIGMHTIIFNWKNKYM